MKTTRLGVFETNSSSVHAIVINKKNMAENSESISIVKGADYGWRFDEYRNPYEKINYLWTALIDNDKDLDEWESYLKEVLELDDTQFVKTTKDDDSPWIDHPDLLTDFIDRLRDDKDLLKKFIYGDSYILTGNDNVIGESVESEVFDKAKTEETDDYYIYGKWN